jgi:hypothetical protein
MDFCLNSEFSNTGNITLRMRRILADWLLEVCFDQKMKPTTIHLVINLLDIFLEKSEVNMNKLQCVGSACLYIASTIEEIYSMDIDSLIYYMADTYPKEEFINCYKNILNVLGYKIYYNTYYDALIQKSPKDPEFSNYLLYTMLITRQYCLFDKHDLVNNIITFCDNIDNTNIIHKYILESWSLCKNSKGLKLKCPQSSSKPIPDITFLNCQDIVPIANTTNNGFNIFDISEYCRDKKLGEGTYGTVVKYVSGKDKVAIKNFKKTSFPELSSCYLIELNILMMCKHKNIITCHGYNHNNNNCYIALELMDDNLADFLKKVPISRTEKRSYIRQIVDAVAYIHSLNISHRDLTINNILIKDNIIKICDFGMSRKICDYSLIYSGNICSLPFRPLDFIFSDHNRAYGLEFDVWSVGCIIGYILKEYYLFDGNDITTVIKNIYSILGEPENEYFKSNIRFKYNIYNNYTGCPDLESKYPEETKLMLKMLKYDKSERISMKDSLKYIEDFFTQI